MQYHLPLKLLYVQYLLISQLLAPRTSVLFINCILLCCVWGCHPGLCCVVSTLLGVSSRLLCCLWALPENWLTSYTVLACLLWRFPVVASVEVCKHREQWCLLGAQEGKKTYTTYPLPGSWVPHSRYVRFFKVPSDAGIIRSDHMTKKKSVLL